MKTRLLSLSLFLHLALLASGQTGATEQALSEARWLAESGQHSEAEAIYNRLLAQDPNNPDALIGAGYNYSWNKQYDKARLSFETALSLNNQDPRALVGQGYNYAWAGRFDLAKHSFERLGAIEPENPEAAKGMGYVNLWQGNSLEAGQYFRDLAVKYPRETEYRIALAQAYLLNHEVSKARIALRSALQIDSANRIATELLQRTDAMAAPLELDIWAGYSSTEGESKFTIRTLQVTGQVSRKVRMYLKYDNSLSSDLAALVRANQEAQALSLGAVTNWNKHLTTRIEAGARILPDRVTQKLLNGEQVIFLPKGMLVKLGGFYGWSGKVADEWLAYGGVRFPITRWYALEPYFFRSQVEKAPHPENRFMLNNQFRSDSGYELNIGLLYGIAGMEGAASDKRILGSYATAILPFSKIVWGQVSVRWEDTPYAGLTILSAGLKFRLEK